MADRGGRGGRGEILLGATGLTSWTRLTAGWAWLGQIYTLGGLSEHKQRASGQMARREEGGARLTNRETPHQTSPPPPPLLPLTDLQMKTEKAHIVLHIFMLK